MSTYAVEVSKPSPDEKLDTRWWLCGFCHTTLAIVLTKPDAVPGHCCNCGVKFLEWKEFAKG